MEEGAVLVPHPFQVVGVEEVAHHPCQVGAVGVVQIPSQVEGEVVSELEFDEAAFTAAIGRTPDSPGQ